MNYVVWLIAGVLLGGVLLLYARAHGIKGEKRILSVALVIAAVIYIGFAFVWGNTAWIAIEIAGVPAYGVFVWLAIRHSFYWLAVGWGFHPAWDVVLHLLGPGHAIVPEWYAVACISFDLLVAGYILARTMKSKNDRVVDKPIRPDDSADAARLKSTIEAG
ncbi:MAG: DUF6010 family protein [Pseudomonadota bacterium]